MWGVTSVLGPSDGERVRCFPVRDVRSGPPRRRPSSLMRTQAAPPVARAEVNPRRLNEIVTSMAGLRTTVTEV